MSTLLPFHTQLANAWKLFLHRWGSAVLFQLPTLIPSVLMLPLATQYVIAVEQGIDPSIVFRNTSYAAQFWIGFILMILIGIYSASGMGILFAAKKKISFWTAAIAAAGRFLPVLYTTILTLLATLAAFLPAIALNWWYRSFARAGAPLSEGGIVALDAIIAIALVALMIPAAIVAVWVMYAPLATALKAAPAGFTSLMFSKHLVHGHFWQVFLKLVGSLVLFQVLSGSVSSLPYASTIVPFVLTIIIIAFFVELYKELQQ